MQQRVDHTVKKLLPPLHGLVSLATDGPLLPTGDLEELVLTLGELQSALRQALPPSHISTLNNEPDSQSSSSLPLPPMRNNKRGAPSGLMPPSPEAKQKRKYSGSTH